MPQGQYIIRTRHPIHDLENLCRYGQDLIEASPDAYTAYETQAEAEETGGHPRKGCLRVKQRKPQRTMQLL